MGSSVNAPARQEVADTLDEFGEVRAHRRRHIHDLRPSCRKPAACGRTERANAALVAQLTGSPARNATTGFALVGYFPILDAPTAPVSPITLLLVSLSAIADAREFAPDDAPQLPHESNSRNDALNRDEVRGCGLYSLFPLRNHDRSYPDAAISSMSRSRSFSRWSLRSGRPLT
jgi:hypothetical protein